MSDDILEIIDIWVQFMKVCAFLPPFCIQN